MEDGVQPLKRGITFTFLQPQILPSRGRPTIDEGVTAYLARHPRAYPILRRSAVEEGMQVT